MKMAKRKKGFWEYVNTDNECIYCSHPFPESVSVYRVKYHLSGETGGGVKACDKVPDGVREEARAAVSKSKTPKTGASSSCGGARNTGVNADGHFFDGNDNRRDAIMAANQGVQALNAEQEEGAGLPCAGFTLDEIFQSAEESDPRGEKLLVPEPVGEASDKNVTEICSLLKKDYVFRIGIHGIGGVGKTDTAKRVNNKLIKEEAESFNYVYWVTVTQNFSIRRLQDLIAKTIKLDLSKEEDIPKRAAKLHNKLTEKGKAVLILDDLWEHFDVQEVGIPVGQNGLKLIITSRSLEVCQRMSCEEKIEVACLFGAEAWELFLQKLGKHSSLVEPLAECVARECDGLPLGIIALACSMRGVDELYSWENVLRELKESKATPSDMGKSLFDILKFSYVRLGDVQVQKCFLHCALFPEDFSIDREVLVEQLIDVGIIEAMRSRKEQCCKGLTMLDKLVKVGLLESVNQRYVKMHDLIRDMAIQELRENWKAMIEAGQQLEELPDTGKWTKDLVTVSLMYNSIEKILASHSTTCLNLSTLLLCRNTDLNLIEDAFFMGFPNLEVLDLSYTAIRVMPDSISSLVNLRALSARGCGQLQHMPSLQNLTALKSLELSLTALEEVPHGIKFLSKLHYLGLYGGRKKELQSGVLTKLSHLQVLELATWQPGMHRHPVYWQSAVTAIAAEMASLTKLETLHCHFKDLQDFSMYIKSWKGQQKLSDYTLLVGGIDEQTDETFSLSDVRTSCWQRSKRFVCLCNCSSISREAGILELPKGMEQLMIAKCHDARSLCNVSSLEHATELKSITIAHCYGMECLLSTPLDAAERIENIKLYRLDKLLDLLSRGDSTPSPWPSRGTFSRLESLEIRKCHSMRILLPSSLVENLQNLRIIRVRECSLMEEIIAVEEEEGDNCTARKSEFNLPKLQTLNLDGLPELKSICNAKLRSNLGRIYVQECPKLKRMPPSFLLVDNGQDPPSPLPSLKSLYVWPEEWWDSVEWDNHDAKNILQPFCQFYQG